MNDFLDVDLTNAQAEALGRAMLAVARSDGAVDPREVALIEELAPLGKETKDPDPSELLALFPGEAQRELVLRCGLLVALVDGGYSDAEKALLARWAAAFSVPPERLEGLASSVKAFLMAPLLPLANTQSVVEVSSKLQV